MVIGVLVVALMFMFRGGDLLQSGISAAGSMGVVGTDCPDFKSNYGVTKSYTHSSTWVATDCNDDGQYEGYGFYIEKAGNPTGTPTGRTPEGNLYWCYFISGERQVYISHIENYHVEYKPNYGSSSSADLTCEGGGGCTPQTCSELGKECGSWADGCGGYVSCGLCQTGYTCDSTGQCICNPFTCSHYLMGFTYVSLECGSWTDGCGGTLNCGTCTIGSTCSSMGQCISDSDCYLCASLDEAIDRAELGDLIEYWVYGSVCGNGVWERGESTTNCPADCGDGTYSCYICATDDDAIISRPELGNIITHWLNS